MRLDDALEQAEGRMGVWKVDWELHTGPGSLASKEKEAGQ